MRHAAPPWWGDGTQRWMGRSCGLMNSSENKDHESLSHHKFEHRESVIIHICIIVHIHKIDR